MLRTIDKWINGFTMYQLTIWGLASISAVAVAFGFVGVLSYSGTSLLLSLAISLAVCEGSNRLFARIFHAAPSVESAGITALILFFLLPPVTTLLDAALLALAGLVAMASKYLLVWRNQHIFNPAAFGAAFVGFTMLGGATWWVATASLLPFVTIVGLLMVRKIRRFGLFFSGAAASILTVFLLRLSTATGPLPPEETFSLLWQILTVWPIIFFTTVMLTEPATAPPTKSSQIWYGIFVGVLSTSALHIGPVYATPEVALLTGNLLFSLLYPKQRMMLKLKEKMTVAKDVYHFVFSSDRPLAFQAGQYLEWTLPHANPDNRGNRRYFTIASAPSETDLAIGVKIQEKSSSFKRALASLQPGDTLSASQRSGDFVLPKRTDKKLVFIAGGIGITPFRSMVQELVTKETPRDITLFYACATSAEFAYEDLWLEAGARVGLKTVHLVNKIEPTETWTGYTGYLTTDMVKQEVPDWKTRLFFLSGPQGMVDAYRTLLKSMGVKNRQIKTDYFPGF